ncbi:hypothetical protein HZB01_04980, partial [Candidatus Woesearchaeota archaeon]|nr:hypothetical protein [Candidatus Woesearchaeota archaeon]
TDVAAPSANSVVSPIFNLTTAFSGPSLETPKSGDVVRKKNIPFKYRILDPLLTECLVYIDGTLNQTHIAPYVDGTNNSFFLSLTNGPHSWSVTCRNGTAYAQQSLIAPFTVDYQGPYADLLEPEANARIEGTSDVTFKYIVDDPTVSNCSLMLNGTVINPRTVLSGQRIEFTKYSLVNGYPYFWNVTCESTDIPAKIVTTATRMFTVNETGPLVAPISPASGSSFANPLVNFTFTAYDPDGLGSCQLIIDNVSEQLGSVINSKTQHTIVTKTLVNGRHNWTVNCKDVGQHQGIVPPLNIFMVNSQAPDVSLNAPANGYVSTTSNLLFNFTATSQHAIDQCTLVIDGVLTAAVPSSGPIQSGSPTLISYRRVANGAYAWNVRCRDVYGGTAESSSPRTITVSRPVPTVSIQAQTGSSTVNITLNFSAPVTLDSVIINDIRNQTYIDITDRMIAGQLTNTSYKTSVTFDTDGEKEITVIAEEILTSIQSDELPATVNVTNTFSLDVFPMHIFLRKPLNGKTTVPVFNLTLETDEVANNCRWATEQHSGDFTSDGTGNFHSYTNFNLTQQTLFESGSATLSVNCTETAKNQRHNATFTLETDTLPPVVQSFTITPSVFNTGEQVQSPVTLSAQATEAVVCRYAVNTTNATLMTTYLGTRIDPARASSYSTNPRQVFNTLLPLIPPGISSTMGTYIIGITCQDMAGNSQVGGTSSTTYTINLLQDGEIFIHSPAQAGNYNVTTIYFNISTLPQATGCQLADNSQFTGTNVRTMTNRGGGFFDDTLTLVPGRYTRYMQCAFVINGNQRNVGKDVTFQIDQTPPSNTAINDSSEYRGIDSDYTYETSRLRVRFFAEDNESGIEGYYYSLWQETPSDLVKNWTFTSDEDPWVAGLNLTDGRTYYFKAYAKNGAGMVGVNVTQSDGITVNTSLRPVGCGNGIKDLGETDVDCGGPCTSCSLNKNCKEDDDCTSDYCSSANKCEKPTCNDRVKNQDETDKDCGGDTCDACTGSMSCKVDSDCKLKHCDIVTRTCKESTCSNGVQELGEGGIDCGGVCPLKCEIDDSCQDDVDCTSTYCKAGYCKPKDDKDADGMPDSWEMQYGLNPLDASDAALDPDQDGYTNLQEYKYGTDPNTLDIGSGDGNETGGGGDTETPPPDQTDSSGGGFWTIVLFVLIVALLGAGGYVAYTHFFKKSKDFDLFNPRIPPSMPPMSSPLPPGMPPLGSSPSSGQSSRGKGPSGRASALQHSFSAPPSGLPGTSPHDLFSKAMGEQEKSREKAFTPFGAYGNKVPESPRGSGAVQKGAATQITPIAAKKKDTILSSSSDTWAPLEEFIPSSKKGVDVFDELDDITAKSQGSNRQLLNDLESIATKSTGKSGKAGSKASKPKKKP